MKCGLKLSPRRGIGGATMEKWLTTILDREYEVVVHSEGVEPHLGRRSEGLGFLSVQAGDPVRLAVPKGTPENSVVLIKGRPSDEADEFYRLFHVKDGRMVEFTTFYQETIIVSSEWHLRLGDGQLVCQEPGTKIEVAPNDWGYCLIVEKGWTWREYEEALRKEAQVVLDLDKVDILKLLIQERRDAERLESALGNLAYKLVSPDLLGAAPPRRRQKGHLRALVNSPEPTQHCAAGVVLDLRDLYDLCREVLPDLPELEEGALDA